MTQQTQKIVPNLWFNGNAEEAIDFYVSVFPDSKIHSVQRYPSSTEEGLAEFQKDLAGKVLTIEFSLAGYEFVAINAGPEFAPTPALSFFVNFDPSRMENPREQLDAMWEKLIDGGTALMPLQEYPFSKHYGWVQDKYGFSWQLMLTNPDGEPRPMIVPCLMFGGANNGRGQEAVDLYTGLFDAQLGNIVKYDQPVESIEAGSIMYGDFQLARQWFAVMDSGPDHVFTFNEAVSLAVKCDDQAEIDKYWSVLSTVPESEQCGWCKDQLGVSWQIVPAAMGELMSGPDAYGKMMQMKKIIIKDLEEAN